MGQALRLLLCERLHWRLPAIRSNLVITEQFLQGFQPCLLPIILEVLTELEDLFLCHGVSGILLHKSRLECLNLGAEQAEGSGSGDF